MDKINLFPVSIYSFNNDTLDNDKLISLLDDETFGEHNALSSIDNLHVKDQFCGLFNWINSCLNMLKDDHKYDCDMLEISSSWANKYYRNSDMYHAPHRHSMSLWSGIYYLTEGAPTVFEDPVFQRTHAQIEVLQHEFSPFYRINPEPGKLILFPSWMYHSTMPNFDDTDRYTISFNVLPTGKINYNLARDSIAVIKLESTIKKDFFEEQTND